MDTGIQCNTRWPAQVDISFRIFGNVMATWQTVFIGKIIGQHWGSARKDYESFFGWMSSQAKHGETLSVGEIAKLPVQTFGGTNVSETCLQF